jgi:hypothetical protein
MRVLVAVFMLVAISAHAEVIEIHDYIPPKVLPKPAGHWNPRALPPYSDEAIVRDAWVRVWLLLDVDAHGKVQHFKFLSHPGYDLEPIAAREVWQLSFDPALDHHDRPTETLILWRIEWPSYGWMMARFGSIAVWPRANWFTGLSPVMSVPCAGSGPMQLESVHPTYRDCSQPDVSHVDTEPWIDRY